MRDRSLVTDERGGVVIIVAASLVAIITIVALVIDLGALRAERRINRALTDVAARAGVGQLQFGPWAGVCKARAYLLGNGRRFSSFDTGSEHWSNAAAPRTTLGSNPCTDPAAAPYTTRCTPNSPGTWARLTATAQGGDVTVEIASGYAMPDPRFREDAVIAGDAGDPVKGSCDNLAVIVTQRHGPLFAGIIGAGRRTTTVRSVGRLNTLTTLDYLPALLLLEQHKCNVLQTGGSTTRVFAQPYEDHPGVIQIDSAADDGSCPQPIINGQATSGGPSIVACSARTSNPTAGCNVATANKTSRIGVYALNFNRPAGHISTAYPGTYGDARAVPSPISGRRNVDIAYRQTVANLDREAQGVLTGNSGRPPGCGAPVLNSCTGAGRTWLVVQGTECSTTGLSLLAPRLLIAQNVWFNCDLNVTAPLTLAGLDSYVVVTGRLDVNSAFTIADPRTIYIGGQASGPQVGLSVGGGTSVFNVNLAGAVNCLARVGLGKTTTMVVGNGSMKLSSGGVARLCQTFVYMASGYGKVPATDGTAPCACPYSGTVDIGSGAFADWSAPNLISGRRPNPGEIQAGSPYEDLALWTEAGGTSNTVTGGSATSMAGIYFLGNADQFKLAGGGTLPVNFSAQFISRTMQVTGNAVVNLVPNPHDSIPVTVYSILLVR